MIRDLRFPPVNIAAVFFFQFESQILPEDEFHVLNRGQDVSCPDFHLLCCKSARKFVRSKLSWTCWQLSEDVLL